MSEQKKTLEFDEKESGEIAQALAAGMAAIEFLQEITVELELDPKQSTVDDILNRIKDLKETEGEYDRLRDLDHRGEDQ